MNKTDAQSVNRWPKYGWIGLGLTITSWTLNWSLPGLRTHILFFPLWLGYCLTVDALVYRRTGSSLLTRSAKKYILLFVISAPAWWLFEVINWRTQNWFYLGRESFTDLQYSLFATLSFSTVIPAIFGTAELVSSFEWLKRAKGGPRIGNSNRTIILFFVLGWVMLYLMLNWPRIFFTFVWLSVFFILEPINAWLKHRNLFIYTSRKDWRPVLALWTGCLICGFFWEMWNFYAYPKWIYDVPFVGFFKVFEMPILGYLGYLPFSLELFAFYCLVTGLFSKSGQMYVLSEWKL